MGRPLNKKYFGNRNIGSTGTGDNYGIGGEGLAAYTLDAQKGVVAINNTYKYFPALSIPAPNLPTGVQATATVVWEVNTVTIAGGTGYTAGTITSITGLDDYSSTDCRFTITVDGSGVPTFDAFTTRGEFTSIDGTGITTWAVVKDGDGAAQATITFRLKSITTVEKGSGYTSVPTLSWTRASSQTAGGQTQTGTPTVALTTDSGSAGSATNQENAIIGYAYVPAANGGTQRLVCDIKKQTNDRRYKVTTAEGTGICQLVTDGVANAAGELDITAYDSDNGEYWVWKLTSRKVVLVVKGGGSGGTQFATGTSVPWTFGNAVEDYSVKIENA